MDKLWKSLTTNQHDSRCFARPGRCRTLLHGQTAHSSAETWSLLQVWRAGFSCSRLCWPEQESLRGSHRARGTAGAKTLSCSSVQSLKRLCLFNGVTQRRERELGTETRTWANPMIKRQCLQACVLLPPASRSAGESQDLSTEAHGHKQGLATYIRLQDTGPELVLNQWPNPITNPVSHSAPPGAFKLFCI